LNYVAVLVKSTLTDPLKALSEPQPSDSVSCNGAETLIIARALHYHLPTPMYTCHIILTKVRSKTLSPL